MRLRELTLQAPADRLDELRAFYGRLGLVGPTATSQLIWAVDERGEVTEFPPQPQPVTVRVGGSELTFGPAPDGAAPYYHFALLVPGDRMEEALEWAIVRKQLDLLPLSEDRTDLVMHFENWQAHSVYFHDPAANIVELIAHHGFGHNELTDEFSPREFLGISEIGLIGNPPGVAAALSERLGLSVFQGSVETMAFIGEPTAALILAEEQWRWLPHGREAEAWPATVVVEDVGGSGWAAAGIHQVSVAGSEPGVDG